VGSAASTAATGAARRLDIEPLPASFGALVRGVRLAVLEAQDWHALRAAWLEYALLIFPDQHLDRAEQIAFARRFGRLEFTFAAISNLAPDGSVRTDAARDDVLRLLEGNLEWHADSSYLPVMATGAVFSARVVPRSGGQTEWADMRAGYEALDADQRARIAGLSAWHSIACSQARIGHVVGPDSDMIGYGFDAGTRALRPLVKVHPETGRRSLLIGRHAHAIPGLAEAESSRLLDELTRIACRPPRVYSHAWAAGDVAVWDNRCLLHRARPWDPSEARVMWHTRIAGDPASEAASA
jgi:alpha-ketoglutarate-dependent taurine dioxygenase